MKRIIALVFIVIAIIMFPTKNEKKSQEVFSIGKNSEITTYKNNIIFFEDNKLISKNKENDINYEIDIKTNNCFVQNNYYIDIIDKENNRIISIDNEGEIVNQVNVPRETIIYKTIDEYTYVNYSTKNNDKFVSIGDTDGNIIREIEVSDNVVDIIYDEKYIYIVDISIENRIKTNISKYDKNGNFKNKMTVEDPSIYVYNDNESIKLLTTTRKIEIDKNLNIISDKEIDDICLESDKVESIDDNIYFLKDDLVYNEDGKVILRLDKKANDIQAINNNSLLVIYDDSIETVKLD